MSPATEPMFPPRSERDYAVAAVETFPWPVMAGYDDIHRWMDQGQAVHAAWQVRDVWEGLLKFLATLAVADHLAAAPAEDQRTKKLLAQLLKKDGLTNGTWATLMEIALKDGPPVPAWQDGPELHTRFAAWLAALMRAEALADHASAITLREDLVRQEGRRELASDLARSYAAHAKALLHVGQLEKASKLAREAVSILETEAKLTGRADLRQALELAQEVCRATIQSDKAVEQEKMTAAQFGARNESPAKQIP